MDGPKDIDAELYAVCRKLIAGADARFDERQRREPNTDMSGIAPRVRLRQAARHPRDIERFLRDQLLGYGELTDAERDVLLTRGIANSERLCALLLTAAS